MASKAAPAPVSSEPAPAKTESSSKYESGYGEEPDTAAPPASFDHHEDSGAQATEAENHEEYHEHYDENPANAPDEPLQMKEDG